MEDRRSVSKAKCLGSALLTIALSDVVAVLGSMNIIAAELDR